uniref:porphobilinogen synthase n=1 Tax=Nelumbo nucifera TaxID=4432 RepID=A0A822YST3_NELNU|nr:TPA_asm: hypothetical protein HUJ06_005793 [Nelumbo nucifera]
MACSISISSSNVPASKHLDGKKHVGLRSSATNVKFVINAGHAIKTPSSRFFLVIKASNEQETSKRSGLSIGDCGSAVVAGIIPEALPVPPKPAAPVGTPLVSSPPLNRRPRCNQKNKSPANFVYPLFIHEGEEDTPIGALPGCYGLGWRHGLVEEVHLASIYLEVKTCAGFSIAKFCAFPKVPHVLKEMKHYNDNGLVTQAIRLLKDKYPDLISLNILCPIYDHLCFTFSMKVIHTDVTLDPYSSDGHDSIIREDGVIMNDETVHQLCKQAVSQAQAGVDVVPMT